MIPYWARSRYVKVYAPLRSLLIKCHWHLAT